MVRVTRKGEVDKTVSSQDYITIVCLWNQLGQLAIAIRIPKSTSNYFNRNTSLWNSFLQKFYFATFKLIWCINVRWIHKPLYVEIKAVFLYINSTPVKQGTVSLNRQLPTYPSKVSLWKVCMWNWGLNNILAANALAPKHQVINMVYSIYDI